MVQKLGFFESKEWLDACVSWCKDSSPNLNGNSLLSAVKEQWLLADIRGDGVQGEKQLNTDWKSAKLLRLNKTLHLQLLYAIDIAQSAYAQLQAVMKVDTANMEENTTTQLTFKPNTSSSRTLKFLFSDGFSNIEAIEHEPLLLLQSSAMKPGLKVQILPPIVIRRGTILLSKNNLRIVGGGVEEMEEEFGTKAVLTRIVGTDNVGQYGNSTIGLRPMDRPIAQAVTVPQQQSPVNRNQNMAPSTERHSPVQAIIPSEPNPIAERNPVTASIKPFSYLSNLPKSVQDWSSIFTVKACVISLATKLSVIAKDWSLSVIITDGSDSRNVSLSSALLNKWIGASPIEYGKMGREDKEKTKQAVMDISDHLLKFNGLMKLGIEQNKPSALEMINLNRGHIQQLRIRSKKNP